MASDIELLQGLVVKDLELQKPVKTFGGLEELRIWLTTQITLLLDSDMQKLMNILYRIDVSENKVKVAFSDNHPAKEIADLIIERELQKVETRRKYRNQR
jgi:hypothetical protein